jgi:hypothetical protein
MHPEYYQSTSLTFTGKAALEPMHVNETKTGGEIILSRVEGRVTTTKADGTTVDAGGAWAQIHVLAKKGAPPWSGSASGTPREGSPTWTPGTSRSPSSAWTAPWTVSSAEP